MLFPRRSKVTSVTSSPACFPSTGALSVPPVSGARKSSPKSGWTRIAYYGFGYYVGLAGLCIFAVLVYGGLTHWWFAQPTTTTQQEMSAKFGVHRALYEHALMMACGGFLLSCVEIAIRRATPGRGLWVNFTLILTYSFLMPFFLEFRVK